MLNKTWTAKLDDKRTSRYQLYSKAIVYEVRHFYVSNKQYSLYTIWESISPFITEAMWIYFFAAGYCIPDQSAEGSLQLQ